jgi:hypothetical protein
MIDEVSDISGSPVIWSASVRAIPSGSDSVYDASGNAIYSLTTGSKTWQGPILGGVGGSPFGYGDLGGHQGAISGSYIVYSFGNRVMLYGY